MKGKEEYNFLFSSDQKQEEKQGISICEGIRNRIGTVIALQNFLLRGVNLLDVAYDCSRRGL